MAKKKTAAAKKTKATNGLAVSVVVDAFDGPAQYVNHAEVTHSQHEFIITWAQIATKLRKSKLEELAVTHELVVDPVAQLMLPPTLVPSLIEALQIQLGKYEEETGKKVAGETK